MNITASYIVYLVHLRLVGYGLVTCFSNSYHRTGHVSAYMLDVLHWLPLQQQIMFCIGAMVWRCILGLAPAYLRDLCHPTPGTRGCSSLRSSEQGLLFVPFARTTTTQARAFSVVGHSVWNGLPLSQRLLPRILSDTFYSSLKTLLFSRARVGSASE